jgi:hypothetical protein
MNYASHMKMHDTVEIRIHAILSLATDGGVWLVSQTSHFNPSGTASGAHWLGGWVGTRGNMVVVVKRTSFEDSSSLLGFNMCHWQVVLNIKKDHVSVTFKDQSMNKISYLWLEWNPNSLVAKPRA